MYTRSDSMLTSQAWQGFQQKRLRTKHHNTKSLESKFTGDVVSSRDEVLYARTDESKYFK